MNSRNTVTHMNCYVNMHNVIYGLGVIKLSMRVRHVITKQARSQDLFQGGATVD